eukprot:GILI01007668.1.p1 GENE.GILI01007668.1~~GILI01007668.1.p1  ORF type:complete len:895 (-),score=211.38 GILI01007668.1:299-2983(-)
MSGLVVTPRRPEIEHISDLPATAPGEVYRSGGQGSIAKTPRPTASGGGSGNTTHNTSIAGPSNPPPVNGKGQPPRSGVPNSSIHPSQGAPAPPGASQPAYQNPYNFVQTCTYKGSNGRLYTRQHGILFNSAAYSMTIAWRHIESITTGSQNTGGHFMPLFTIKVRTDKPSLVEEFAFNECPNYKSFLKKEAQQVADIVTQYVTNTAGAVDNLHCPTTGGVGSDINSGYVAPFAVISPATSLGQVTDIRSTGSDPLLGSSNVNTNRSEIDEMLLTLRRELDSSANVATNLAASNPAPAGTNGGGDQAQRVTPRAHQRLVSNLSELLDATMKGNESPSSQQAPTTARSNANNPPPQVAHTHYRRGSDHTSNGNPKDTISPTAGPSSEAVPTGAHVAPAKGAGGSSNASQEPVTIAYTRAISGASLLGPISTIALVAGTDDSELCPSGTYTFALDTRGGDAHVAAASLKGQMGTYFIELCTLAVEQRKYDLIAVAKGLAASPLVESAAAIQLEFSSQCSTTPPKSIAEFYNCVVGAAVTAFRGPTGSGRLLKVNNSNASRSVWGPRLSEFASDVVLRADAMVYSILSGVKASLPEAAKLITTAALPKPQPKMDPNSFPVLYQTNGAAVVAAPRKATIPPTTAPAPITKDIGSSGSSTSTAPNAAAAGQAGATDASAAPAQGQAILPALMAILNIIDVKLVVPVSTFIGRKVIPKQLVASKRRRVKLVRYLILGTIGLMAALAWLACLGQVYGWAFPPPSPQEIAHANRITQIAAAEKALEQIMFGDARNESADADALLSILLEGSLPSESDGRGGDAAGTSHHLQPLTQDDLAAMAKKVALARLTSLKPKVADDARINTPMNYQQQRASRSVLWSPTFLLFMLAAVISFGTLAAKFV